VYRAVWEWVVERHGEFGRIRNTPGQGQLELIENGCRVVTKEEVGEDQWCVGHRPCRREREVYVDQSDERSRLISALPDLAQFP
jgi:hypothetical protein